MSRRPLPPTTPAAPPGPLLCLLMLLCIPAVQAERPAMAGEEIALYGTPTGVPACSSCHGTEGEGNPADGFPRLAGLPAPYLFAQLQALANGSRNDVMMSPVAILLTTPQRQQLSAYYASLPAAVTTQNAAPPIFAAGRELATRGNAARQIPACNRCHGSQGSGVGSAFPPLAGQSPVYLENQLQLWQAGQRPAGPLGLMPDIARRLSAEEVSQVAGYYSRLLRLPVPPLPMQRETP